VTLPSSSRAVGAAGTGTNSPMQAAPGCGDRHQAVGMQAVGLQAVGLQAVGLQAVGLQAVGLQAVGTGTISPLQDGLCPRRCAPPACRNPAFNRRNPRLAPPRLDRKHGLSPCPLVPCPLPCFDPTMLANMACPLPCLPWHSPGPAPLEPTAG
jgi:hypothetical protein